MERIVECITVEHDPMLVALAAAVCLLACHSAVKLFSRASSSATRSSFWLLAASVSLGSGVWSTHFIAMLAFQSTLPIRFDIGITVLSAAMAVLIAAGAFWIAYRGQFLIAGAVSGFSVMAMHYTGMSSLQGPIAIVWDEQLIIVSALLGVVLSIGAFGSAATAGGRWMKYSMPGLLVLAICSLHFTGMAAMNVVYLPVFDGSAGGQLDRLPLAIAVGTSTTLILGAGLALAHLDHFVEARNIAEETRLRAYVEQLERTQHELRNKTVELEEAVRVADQSSETKSRFLAVMSHELRTPLNAIIGFSELMQMQAKGPLGHPDYMDYLKDIYSSGHHLLELVNGILDFSKIEAGELSLSERSFPLNDMLGEAIRMVEGQAREAGVVLIGSTNPTPVSLNADRGKMSQVLLNILSNAIKFSEAGDRVEIRVRVGANELTISIVDEGIGIHPDDLDRALEAFGQVDNDLNRTHEGTGLGLPISLRLVELHGGKLKLTSQPGKGTQVDICLPIERVSREELVSVPSGNITAIAS